MQENITKNAITFIIVIFKVGPNLYLFKLPFHQKNQKFN